MTDDTDLAQMPHVLREYAVLADGERAALVGPRGDISWLCVPHFDSDAVLGGLIGAPGSYVVTPRGRYVWGGSYETGTLVWVSRWIVDGSIVECREALAYPGEPGRAVLLRQLRARQGETRVHISLDLRAGFGAHGLTKAKRDDDGTWTGRCGDLAMRWQGAGDATAHSHGGGTVLELDLVLAQGEKRDLVLELGEPGDPVDPGLAWDGTTSAWERAVPPLSGLVAERDARHARAVLRGLTGPAGAMVAAVTTSLPERAMVGRNYDYRFAWVRDQAFTGLAAASAGDTDLLDDAVRFLTNRLLADGPQLTPAYTARGGRVPDQRSLNLPGYPGGTDVVGNHVNSQFQLDAFGETLQVLAAAARADRLDADGWQAIVVGAEAIAKRWQEPDAGIWELDDKPWAESRLAAAAGLRVAAAVHPNGEAASGWIALADRIVADTSTTSLHPTGRWQRAPDDERIDAALLLPGLRGAVPVGDPRTAATYQAVLSDLAEQGYVYRYRHDARPLADAEGAFLLCGFLAALAAQSLGDGLTAVRFFERNRAACGPPGLFTEEYDVGQRQLRGNLPQAFVHALLLECTAALAD